MRLLGLIAVCSYAALATGCPGESPPAGSSDETTGATTTGGAEGTSTSTGPALTSTGMDEGTTVAPPGTTTDEGTSSSGGTTGGTDSSGGESSGTTGEPSMACASGCAVEFACGERWLSEEECVIACEANLVKAGRFSVFCQLAWENLSECLGTLTCEEFLQWQSPMAFPYPCSDADVILEVECEGQ